MSTIYVQSDLHVDYYCVHTTNYNIILPDFENFYKTYMHPADILYVAGDIANDFITQKFFLIFLSEKYKEVYYCFGNHDLSVKGTYLGQSNEFKTSEQRMLAIIKFFENSNVHILEGNIINGVAGCLGMTDFTYSKAGSTVDENVLNWCMHSYDSKHWNYKGNKPFALSKFYKHTLNRLIAEEPNIVMTHYCPLELGLNPKFEHDKSTSRFFFYGKQFLDKMQDGSIWICGHTHDAYKTNYVNASGKHITIICNPSGYPHEHQYELNNLKPEDFYI